MRTFIKTIITTLAVWTVLAAQDSPKTKFSGLAFGDYFYNVTRDTSLNGQSNVATGGARDFNGFQLRRVYLTADHEFSPKFSARIRLEGTTGAPFFKDLYLKWSGIVTGSDLMVGIQPSPAFEVTESYWGFRSLEKTILDLRGIAPARDFGLSMRGTVVPDGTFKYWILYGNNSSVNAETDKYKRLYGHLDFTPAEKFRVTLYADYKMQAKINDPSSTTVPKKTLGNNVLAVSLMGGYAEKGSMSVGAELILQMTENGYLHGTPVVIDDKTAVGLSIFGSGVIAPDVTLIGRYDYFDPNTASSSSTDLRHLIIAGAQWSVEKNVAIIPNIEIEAYEDVATPSGKRSLDPSVTARVTMFFVFP